MAAQNQGKCVDVLSITGNPVDIGIPNKDSREPMLSPINFSPHVWIKIIGLAFNPDTPLGLASNHIIGNVN